MRRAQARSNRKINTLNIPLLFGVPDAARKEEAINMRRDLLGPIIEHHMPVVPDGSRANLLAAVDKRSNYHSSAAVDPSIIAASMGLLDKISPSPWDPLVHDRALFEDWNAQFDAPKQARHVKAYAKIAECTSAQFSDKQIFVKVEALLKRHDPQWAPRVIYQSSDLHNVMLGPVMWKCTKRMFHAFEHYPSQDGVHFMGAYSKQAPDLVKRIHRHGTSDSVYVESDFSSNDMTQLEDVHLLEILWLTRFGAPAWLTALMHVANRFRATSFKHRVKAVVRNQLPTGAQSTTFRNSLWNSSICYSWCMKFGYEGDVLILGDDMLMRLDNPKSRRQQLRRSYEYQSKLAGMRGEVVVHKHLSECTFLSKEFIPNGSSFVLAPRLGKAIARFNVRATSNEAVSDREYLAGKALSYAYEFRHISCVSRLFLLKYAEAEIDNPSLDALGWNAKGAFLRSGYAGIMSAIASARGASRDDITRFYHWKYNLTCTDLINLVSRTIFGDKDLDPVGMQFVVASIV
jgi:hypothetical protein